MFYILQDADEEELSLHLSPAKREGFLIPTFYFMLYGKQREGELSTLFSV